MIFVVVIAYQIGYGFIDFVSEEDAILALNGYNGRPIRIFLLKLFLMISKYRLYISFELWWKQQKY